MERNAVFSRKSRLFGSGGGGAGVDLCKLSRPHNDLPSAEEAFNTLTAPAWVQRVRLWRSQRQPVAGKGIVNGTTIWFKDLYGQTFTLNYS